MGANVVKYPLGKIICHEVQIQHLHGLIMPCTKVLIFFLFQTSAVLCAEENFAYDRSSYLAMRENKQIKGYVVKRFDSPSLLSCSQQCMRNAWCISTNYKMSSKKDSKGTCELNKHDISLIDDNTNFDDQLGVIFSILLKVILGLN